MPITSKILAGVAMLGLAGCGSTNTKGSWACAADRGVPCSSIATLDGQPGASGAMTARHDGKSPPSVDGAGALRWWTAAETGGGAFDQAPRREPDQFAKVLIGGWIDGSGDYHAPSEVFALMRRGGWWAAPPAVPLVTARSGERTAAPRVAGAGPSPSPVAKPPVAQPENAAATRGAGSKTDAGGTVAARAAPAAVATAKPAGS
jgi:hypothetical protein